MEFDLGSLSTTVDAVSFDLPDIKNGGRAVKNINGDVVRWRIHSPDGEVMRAFERGLVQKQLDGINQKRGNIDDDLHLKAEDVEDQSFQRALVASAGWENLVDKNGNEIPFTPENAEGVLSFPGNRWIVEFVDNKARMRGNFLGATDPAPKK
jgi:hypothetical protein